MIKINLSPILKFSQNSVKTTINQPDLPGAQKCINVMKVKKEFVKTFNGLKWATTKSIAKSSNSKLVGPWTLCLSMTVKTDKKNSKSSLSAKRSSFSMKSTKVEMEKEITFTQCTTKTKRSLELSGFQWVIEQANTMRSMAWFINYPIWRTMTLGTKRKW